MNVYVNDYFVVSDVGGGWPHCMNVYVNDYFVVSDVGGLM